MFADSYADLIFVTYVNLLNLDVDLIFVSQCFLVKMLMKSHDRSDADERAQLKEELAEK